MFFKNICQELMKCHKNEFTTAGMKKCGRQNIRKHMETDNGEKYITLEISLEFCNLDKMKITSLEPKYDLGRLGKGLNNYLGLKKIGSSKTKKRKVMPLLMSV